MTKILFVLLSSFAWACLAQVTPDSTPMELRRGIAHRYSLPIAIGVNGDINIFSDCDGVAFNPVVIFGLKQSKQTYLVPNLSNEFRLEEPRPEARWVHHERQRIETGLGVRVNAGFKLGFAVFKGSQTVSVRQSTERGVDLPLLKLPKDLQGFSGWRPEDEGHFQTYGGMMVYAGLGLGADLGLSAAYSLTNNFIVSVKKSKLDEVLITVEEESLQARKLKLSWGPVDASTTQFKGRLLRMSFNLSLNRPGHALAYQKIMEGRVDQVQKAFPEALLSMSWNGNERALSVGFKPIAVGTRRWFHQSYAGGTEEVYTRVEESKGLLLKKREHRDYVFADTDGLILIWTSRMKDIDGHTLNKHFMKRARSLDLVGFSHARIDEQVELGNVVTQMGVAISRAELEVFAKDPTAPSKAKRLSSLVQKALKRPWRQAKLGLGKTLLLEPQLIRSLVETMKSKKEVHFKFLSAKYQSLWGITPMDTTP